MCVLIRAEVEKRIVLYKSPLEALLHPSQDGGECSWIYILCRSATWRDGFHTIIPQAVDR